MRSFVAVAALAAALGGCQPDSEKTNPAVATDESAAERMQGAPAKGANSFTQEQAREQAVKAGYMDVGALTQASDGAWRGAAMRDGASVTVVVDYQGNVTTSGATAPGAMTPDTLTPGATPTTPSQPN
jgi:putative membrane protein